MLPPCFCPADRFSTAELCSLFNRCYADYYVAIRLDPEGFEAMLEVCDVDLAASRVLQVGGETVGFVNLAVRGARGWIAGMGVLPETRGAGLGRLAMEAVLSVARERGLTSVDLEVLVQNTPAARIYEVLGFRDRRMLEVWTRAPGTQPAPAGADDRPVVAPAAAADCLAGFAALHTERPPWQCDRPTLEHAVARLTGLAVRDGAALAGYVLYRAAGDAVRIGDLAAVTGARPDVFEALVAGVVAAHPRSAMSVLNLPEEHAAGPALERCGFSVTLRQREMTLAL